MKILNVFTNSEGKFGNPVGIVVDLEQKTNTVERQKMATASGFSEIVFVNNIGTKNISIYTPKHEIPFAGHAVVGTAYFLSQEYKTPVSKLVGIGGKTETWKESEFTWVRSSLSIAPKWNYEQLENAAAVESLVLNETLSKEHTVVWAWIDKQKGLIRARTFASDWGIPEDEANGSGSMRLASTLNKEITLIHGKGSVIHARPAKAGNAEVGGLVSIIN